MVEARPIAQQRTNGTTIQGHRNDTNAFETEDSGWINHSAAAMAAAAGKSNRQVNAAVNVPIAIIEYNA